MNLGIYGLLRMFCYSPVLFQIFMWLNRWSACFDVDYRFVTLLLLGVTLLVCALDFVGEVIFVRVLEADNWCLTAGIALGLLVLTVSMYAPGRRQLDDE